MNDFFYHYYYNGAGLAVADFNNDDLIDIYFISNLKSNRLYLNAGNLKFKEVTSNSNLKEKAGNLYESEVETPRNDASYGHYLKGDGNGKFEIVPSYNTGLYIKGEVRSAEVIFLGDRKLNKIAILIGKNNDYLQLIKSKVK